jgi:hypothetical protein
MKVLHQKLPLTDVANALI